MNTKRETGRRRTQDTEGRVRQTTNDSRKKKMNNMRQRMLNKKRQTEEEYDKEDGRRRQISRV